MNAVKGMETSDIIIYRNTDDDTELQYLTMDKLIIHDNECDINQLINTIRDNPISEEYGIFNRYKNYVKRLNEKQLLMLLSVCNSVTSRSLIYATLNNIYNEG